MGGTFVQQWIMEKGQLSSVLDREGQALVQGEVCPKVGPEEGLGVVRVVGPRPPPGGPPVAHLGEGVDGEAMNRPAHVQLGRRV